MTYRILGSDQKEYGPATAELLMDWVRQRRVEGGTLVMPEGASVWKPLSTYPEFAAVLAQAAPPPQPFIFQSALPRRTNSLAIASLVMGILSFCSCCCCLGLPFNLLGLVFSAIALHQIRQPERNESGTELAIAGLVLSLVSIANSILLWWTGLWSEFTSRPEIFHL